MPAAGDSNSIWHLWKWCSVCFELAFVNQFLVTLGFWLLVYPFYPWPMYLLDYARHGLPFVFLVIDFHLNRSEIDSRHWVASVGWMVCYLINTVTYHEYHDSFVYQELHTIFDYAFTVFAACLLQAATHYILVAYGDFAHSFFLGKLDQDTRVEEKDHVLLLVIPCDDQDEDDAGLGDL